MFRGVFGGSFDPIHIGHLIVGSAAADRLRLDVLHFVPAWSQPFKTGGHGASQEDRLAMVGLALAGDPRFVADGREIERGGVSYTIDTLRSLRAEFPDDRLCLLIGADAARDLSAWRDAAGVAALARIVVLTRPGAAVPRHPLLGEVLEVPAVAVSATDVRERVRRGESIAGLVPSPVAAYIESHGLYRAEP